MALSSLVASTFTSHDVGLTLRKLKDQAHDTILANWHLGLTAFGGPPVHFQIWRKKFVDELQWIDEQTVSYLPHWKPNARRAILGPNFEYLIKFQELFAIANSLPGPGSTKMLFNINVLHGGFFSGILAFLIWSLPGAVGMFAFSLGVSRIGEKLPGAVYALLSGLNAATVGIIALAAVQLSQKVATDRLTRILVFLGGAAGMLYTALWYFPVLLIAAGMTTMMWDLNVVQKLVRMLDPRERLAAGGIGTEQDHARSEEANAPTTSGVVAPATSQQDGASTTGSDHSHSRRQIDTHSTNATVVTSPDAASLGTPLPPARTRPILSFRSGIIVFVLFFAFFLTIMLIRGLYATPSRTFSLFANLYLAGTIIFGGGPVVIPLLREYVVAEGWVSPRDFLLGLALIQAFPGPNFNFAVYLGALAVSGTNTSPLAGAAVAFIGIFMPGLIVQSAFMGLWGALRRNRALASALRGVNAAAVGLIFTAVYRLWQIGFLDQKNQDGRPLGGSPWWVVVTATSFMGGTWFGVNPPTAVVLGGIMGMIWYGVSQS